MTQEDAAAKLGKAQSTIANKLRLLRLTETERDNILQYNLTERHARALLRLRAPEERLQILGISADAQKLQSDTHIEYRIRIPVPQQNVHSEQPPRNRLPLS